MEKGALLPLKFYPSESWTDYEKIKTYSGKVALFREHHIFFPSFQMVMPDEGRHWGIEDFNPSNGGGTSIRNYETGATTIGMWNFRADGQYGVWSRAGFHRNLIWNRFPLFGSDPIPAGRYFITLADRWLTGSRTFWHSEVFEVCDLDTNAMTEVFTDDGGFATITPAYNGTREMNQVDICKTGVTVAEAYTPVDVFLGEELDLYVYGRDYGPACGAADWNGPVYFELRTIGGLVVSETVSLDSAVGLHETLTAQVGGTVRLYMYVLAADTTAADVHIWLQRRYSANNVQIRWSHTRNMCNIFYENGYENVMFIDSKQVIDENAIDETVVEDDETNKARIIGTDKKWNSVQFASGEAMLNAMSLMRLHDTIKIVKETGEPMDVAEILMEQSVLNYEASMIKLVYREDSCSAENCGFEVCCPTLGTPISEDVYANGTLPAAGAGNDGDYAIEETVAGDQFRLKQSDGAVWNTIATWSITGNCIEARVNNYDRGTRFYWYDGSWWRRFIELASTADNADGSATITTDTEYIDGLIIQCEYRDSAEPLGEWILCGDPVPLTAGGGAVAVICESGVGTWYFRFRAYTADCEYGYSNEGLRIVT